jgi:uncharacterized protein YerC
VAQIIFQGERYKSSGVNNGGSANSEPRVERGIKYSNNRKGGNIK